MNWKKYADALPNDEDLILEGRYYNNKIQSIDLRKFYIPNNINKKYNEKYYVTSPLYEQKWGEHAWREINSEWYWCPVENTID